ncbi:tyrosine-type recombinase/integrase [Streptomyces sp. NPDC059447]|uniref:tyrosine-type recombinase/integrase n=1 Tax=Streptomyces sp. NPDC059447 TaxID=3346834 RepID=UPI0036AE833F
MAKRALDVYTEWRGGTCRVKWWTGAYHPNGRKRFESKGGFEDEEVAYQHGLDQMHDIRHGVQVSNRDGATLMDDWLDEWLASMDHGHLTERAYQSRVKAHIRPYFGRRTVGEIDVLACRAFHKDLKSKLAPKSAQNVMTLLGMIMDDAVPTLIKTSPVERKRSRGRFTRKPRERKKDMLPEAVEQLARNAKLLFGLPGYAFIWTMAMTGMRPGELYGLTREYCYPNWPASDPKGDRAELERYEEDAERYGREADGQLPAIRVERQVQYADGKVQFFPPKYGSTRTLVIPPFLADLLERVLESHDSKWVFPSMTGVCLIATGFDTNYWRVIANGAEERTGYRMHHPRPAIPAVPAYAGRRLYLLRHGAKTWLDEDGHSRYAVETRMGHDVPGVEGVYSSVTVAMEQMIAKKLQERWETLQDRMGQSGTASVSHSFPMED